MVADRIGVREHSGIGGHEDFVHGRGVLGGRPLADLPAVDRRVTEDGTRLAHRQRAPAGSCVTTPRHQVDVVVTEYGAAELAGTTDGERAAQLAAIAHPAVRDALRGPGARTAADSRRT